MFVESQRPRGMSWCLLMLLVAVGSGPAAASEGPQSEPNVELALVDSGRGELALVFTIVAIHSSLIVLQFTETALVSVLVSQEESCALEAHTLAPILGSAIAVLAGIAQGLLILLTHDL